MIGHKHDNNEINLFNAEEEADVTSIHYINATNDICINDDDNFIHKHYVPFLLSNNHRDVSS